MDHIPPISPFGQPIYGTPMSGQHAVNMQRVLATLAMTLEDDSYKGSDGKIDVDQLSGMIDVLLYFDTKLSHPDFHGGVMDLCKQFEDYKSQSNPDLIHQMQETLKLLGSKFPEMSHNQYIGLITNLLIHVKEEVHES